MAEHMRSSPHLPRSLSRADVQYLEQQLHDVLKALRHGARQRASLFSRIEAVMHQDRTSTNSSAAATRASPEVNGPSQMPICRGKYEADATHRMRERADEVWHRAVITSLTLELAQLWHALVLPWFKSTVVPFEQGIHQRLSVLHARLRCCARRLAPHRAQYRWQQRCPSTVSDLPDENNDQNEEEHVSRDGGGRVRPLALSWYLNTLASCAGASPEQPHPHDVRTASAMPTSTTIRAQLDAHAQAFMTGHTQTEQWVPCAATRRSLAHLLHVWYNVLPPSPSPSLQADAHRALMETDHTFLLALAQKWAETLISGSRDCGDIAFSEKESDGNDCWLALQWLLRGPTSEVLDVGESSAALIPVCSQKPLDSARAMRSRLLASCTSCWQASVPITQRRSPHPPDGLPQMIRLISPRALSALHTDCLALLHTLTPDMLNEERIANTTNTVATTRVPYREVQNALRNAVEWLCSSTGAGSDPVDAYRACVTCLQASWHAQHSLRAEQRLSERLATLRESEARHRRFLQRSEAQWHECTSETTRVMRMAGPSPSLTPPCVASHQREERARVCPLHLLLDPPGLQP